MSVDRQKLADKMVELMINGSPAGYFKDHKGRGLPEGQPLSDIDIRAIAMNGADISTVSKEVLNDVYKDLKNLRSIDPKDFESVYDWKDEIDKKSIFVSGTDFYALLKEEFHVSTFRDLKKKFKQEGK
jgi:hypothetical protein